MPTDGRTRSIRLARASLLAGLASASVCLCVLTGRARGDPLIAAAGDIACDTSSAFFNGGIGTEGHCRQKYTSDLLVQSDPAAVLTLGDNQYHVGSLSDFNASFDPTWGRVKPIIHPTVGNHEYATAGARGYFDYFNGSGNQSGPAGDRDKGYYSFDIAGWHLIALNSECDRIARGAAANGCAAESPQESSLRSDLAAHPSACTLAYWHSPRFNSGFRGNQPKTDAFWRALREAGADVVLNGDAHHYERFAPQDPSGNLDLAGIREFVVGTGGAFFTNWSSVKPNSEVRQNDTFGVLALTLHPTSYEWRFLPEAGKTFTDSGGGVCHGRTPGFGKPSTPAKGLVRSRCTIRGTAGHDRLVGTPKKDVICGLGGNDRIRALAGNDVVRGGAGRDSLYGGRGHDRLYGSSGKDLVHGHGGRDRVVGGRGRDRLYGDRGNDSISSRDKSRSDLVVGGRGRDRATIDKGDRVRSVERVFSRRRALAPSHMTWARLGSNQGLPD
jgi:acid phosphatase type 7